MDFSYYAFAFFVFILVCGAIILSTAANKRSKKERLNMNEKERRLFRLYRDMEDMAAGFEDYIREVQGKSEQDMKRAGELLEQMTDTLAKTQAEAQSVKELYEMQKARGPALNRPIPENEAQKENARSGLVVRLKGDGLNSEQIAKELGISRGEVELILGMKKTSLEALKNPKRIPCRAR